MMHVNPNEKNLLIWHIASHAAKIDPSRTHRGGQGDETCPGTLIRPEAKTPGREVSHRSPRPPAVRGGGAGRVHVGSRYRPSVATGRLCPATVSGAAPSVAEGVWRIRGDGRGPVGYPPCRPKTCPYRAVPPAGRGRSARATARHIRRRYVEAKLKSWQSGTKDHDRKGKTDGPQADPRSRGGHMPESANRNGFELGKISAYSPADHIQVPRYVG